MLLTALGYAFPLSVIKSSGASRCAPHKPRVELYSRRLPSLHFTFSRRSYPERLTVSTGTFSPRQVGWSALPKDTSCALAGNRTGKLQITSPMLYPLSHLTPYTHTHTHSTRTHTPVHLHTYTYTCMYLHTNTVKDKLNLFRVLVASTGRFSQNIINSVATDRKSVV